MKLCALVGMAMTLALGSWTAASAGEEPLLATGLAVKGTIDGENISFRLTFSVEPKRGGRELAIVTGDMVLEGLEAPNELRQLRYDAATGTYFMSFPRSGKQNVSVTFAARPHLVEQGPWREVVFAIPSSLVRELEVDCDRSDLEVQFPGAMRLDRQTAGEKLTVKAVLGPGRPFAVRWKPQVRELDAALVLASDSNTIATAGAGALRLDTLFVFDVAQGKLKELSFSVPAALSVTQVRGPDIRDWRVADAPAAAAPVGAAGAAAPAAPPTKILTVVLARPQTRQYAVQVQAELALADFPSEIELPVIEPAGCIRSSGHIALGTDSAIRLVVRKSAGLSQKNASEFPRIILDQEHQRPLPKSNAFFYAYAATPYQLGLGLDDIVPSYDADQRLVVTVRDDDLTVDAEIDLDVRDAGIRRLTVDVPAGFLVASVKGSQVEDHRVVEDPEKKSQQVEVHFREPVLGRTLVSLRLELGRSPLGAERQVQGISVVGAKNERGALLVAAEKGVQLENPRPENLREVHVSSLPMSAANAQFAYRFRERGWGLGLSAREKPAGVRAEAFHLVSIGEGIAYGSVVVNYFISGAPVDELQFKVPEELQNVEFVGSDVLRWVREKDRVRVKLQRKVLGDYNLGLTYSQRYEDGGSVLVGGVECASSETETETGYICVASHLNLKLEPRGAASPGLLEIDRSEVPANYRLLVTAPMLATYKYVNSGHRLTLGVSAYARTALLPAVVEIMDAGTRLAVGEDGRAESVTRIRYEVKNSSSQFLTLAMPAGATVWSTEIVDRETGERRRVNSSFDRATQLLKIPLSRGRNPNAPLTVELEYGQSHGRLAWGGSIALTAPKSEVRSTYAQWKLTAPKDWAVLPGAGDDSGVPSMVTQASRAGRGRLAVALSGIVDSWGWGVERTLGSAFGMTAGLLLVVLMGLAFAFRRRLLPGLLLGAVVLAALLCGAAATNAPYFDRSLAARADCSQLTFTQALSLDDKSPLAVSAALVPAWRQDVGPVLLFGVPAVSLAALLLALWLRRGENPRRGPAAALAAIGITGLAAAAAALPYASVALGHVLTWGLPAALAAWLLARSIGRRLASHGVPAVAGFLLLGLVLAAGCQGNGRGAPPETDDAIVDRVECTLDAEKDSMVVSLAIHVDARGPLAFPIADQSAILLSPEKPAEHVRVASEGGHYVLHIEKPGKRDIAVKLLVPLAKAGDDGLRGFLMPLPPALVNQTTLTVPEPGMDIEAPTAVKLTREENDKQTVARVVVGPRDPVSFVWKPRTRQTKLEKTVFYSEVTSLFRFDAGLAEGRHQLRFQIAQGELGVIRLRVPAASTVTVVEGKDLGAWRFDPAKLELEARLAKPASGDYEMTVVTQASSDALPATVTVASLEVLGAERQRGTMGLAATPAVFLTVGEHPRAMSPADFIREAGALLAKTPGLEGADIRHAFRSGPGESIAVTVNEVRPEIRVSEMAGFYVGDERLVYDTGAGGALAVTVAKAGVFSVRLILPEGYDIDALGAPEVSHWDESVEDGARSVQIHFKQKLLGSVALKLALSRSVSELPERLAIPRVQVAGELKHTGQIAISAARGIRLSEAGRKGASAVNPLELGRREQGVLVYNILRPDWELVLRPEVVEPRVNVEFLHVARVTEGLVRHTHYLRYRLHNAGVKVFDVDVPAEAMGLLIGGSEIANTRQTSPNHWRVELVQKKFDQPYLLTLRYETRFDREAGEVRLATPSAAGADLQRGHIVVFATDRVELAQIEAGESLQPAEARNVSSAFGAGDLSGAAFCYASTAPECKLSLRATRHDAAQVLEAEVLETDIATVVSERGETINHVRMKLRVGGKRNLETVLPAGARIWSVQVNGRSTAPSERPQAPAAAGATGAANAGAPAANGGKVVLIPLPQTPTGELTADVDFVYVSAIGSELAGGERRFPGPKFDLPLKNLDWRFFLPEGCDYAGFGGTLAVNEEVRDRCVLHGYNVGRYEEEVAQANKAQEAKVDYYQDQGKSLARDGRQYEARYALENAYNYSFNDPARNEDARVQLHNLIRGQAMVGLVGRRGYLRPKTGQEGEPAARQAPAEDLGDSFNQADAERLRNSLSKADSENLERIARSVIEAQEAAAGSGVQIAVSMPLRGRVLEFDRPVQVKPNSEMLVSFAAEPRVPAGVKRDWTWLVGLFCAALLALLALPAAAARWTALTRRLQEDREAGSDSKGGEDTNEAAPESDGTSSEGPEGPMV